MIIREVFVKLLLDSFGKLSISCCDYVLYVMWYAPWLCDQLESFMWYAPWLDKCDGPLTPNVAKVLKFIVTAARKLKVDWNGSDLYQVTCPWVAAIWDMASSGIDTGITESYCNPCHWLSTWKEMYRFKINPVNGPYLCKQVGHNQRGCKSKRSAGDAGVGGSQQGGDVGVGGSQ
ncbi:hypothetical protein Tco_1216378 [Tanacetum coccineum]